MKAFVLITLTAGLLSGATINAAYLHSSNNNSRGIPSQIGNTVHKKSNSQEITFHSLPEATIALLVRRGEVDVDEADKNGDTLLHIYAKQGTA